MGQRGEQLDLASDALGAQDVGEVGIQGLQGNRSMVLEVRGPVAPSRL
jgi:hypothetical protein